MTMFGASMASLAQPKRLQQGLGGKLRQFQTPFAQRFFSGDDTTTATSSSPKPQRPIYIAATRQHVGKTSVSLAIVSGLKRRFTRVGFMKPVGQQHVTVESSLLGQMIRVDKDVTLIRERFGLHYIDYKHMSPVIIPKGYTKRYVDGDVEYEQQLDDVKVAFNTIADSSDIVLCEGTGHCAVGSIVNFNNAKVANILGADMVLVANGGLGSAFDELELNRNLCEHYGVRIAGVIINKVLHEKYDQTKKYMSKALMQAWDIPLLGCIPDRPFLGCPALADLENLFNTKLVCGEEHRYRHYYPSDINLVTTSLTRFLENLREKPSRTLYICHVTRDDLILGFLSEFQRRNKLNNLEFQAALLICGRDKKYEITQEVYDMIKSVEDAPIMMVGVPTHTAMAMIHSYTPKLHIDDANRVDKAVEHYEPYIDFDELLRRVES